MGLKLTASGLANGPLAWTSCTAKTERVGGMVGGYQNDKGTHPRGKGEKRFRHNVGSLLKWSIVFANFSGAFRSLRA